LWTTLGKNVCTLSTPLSISRSFLPGAKNKIDNESDKLSDN
jgi:hypothetical protein